MMIAGASALSADFNRDDSKAIVNDNATGLSWQDDADASSYTATWQGAIDYCEALTLGGYDDWRLPNINELYTIVDRGRSDPAIAAVFVNTASSGYWSSTSNVSNPSMRGASTSTTATTTGTVRTMTVMSGVSEADSNFDD